MLTVRIPKELEKKIRARDKVNNRTISEQIKEYLLIVTAAEENDDLPFSFIKDTLDFEPDKEEEELLEQIERGEFIRTENFEKEKSEAILAAGNFLEKKKNINIRITEYDLLRLKRKSAETTIPYQTLIAAFIHEFAEGRIKLEI